MQQLHFFIMLWVVFCTLVISFVSADRPNLLFIMADDLGWNDVSWRDNQLHTPNLEQLAHNDAVILMKAYVNRLCSITRSAFLGGHYPFHMGTQEGTFFWMEPAGVPSGFKFFPEHLQEAGYKTYLVGKWHLGYCRKEFIPTNRGFHHFRGYYTGMEDYYTHSFDYQKYIGMDFWDEDRPRFECNGTYSTEIYTDDAKEFLTNHNRSQPFFMYLAYQAVHNPLEVPKKYLKPCKQKHKARRQYCGMLNAMDQSIGQVINTLKERGLYENTVIMFSTDNGGDTNWGGNNHPLRGNKATLWEGGTRAVSFVHSPKYIKDTGHRNQLFSIVDWYSTILSVAGLPYEIYGDGINQWSMITSNDSGNRTSLVYNIWPTGSAIRRGKYKMILGDAGEPSGWVPPPNDQFLLLSHKKDDSRGLFLFDLEHDPEERHNLIGKVDVRLEASMLREIAKYLDQMKPSIHRFHPDKRGDPALFNGTFACCWC